MVTMLAEYGFHHHQHVGGSPWSKDLTVFETDPPLPGFDDIQIEIQTIELDGLPRGQSPQEQLSIFAEDDTCSLGTSHLSSEFDEDVNVEGKEANDDRSSAMFGSDFLTNCFINNLHEISVQDGVLLNGIENLESMLDIPIANNIEVVSDDGSNNNNLSPSSSSSSPTAQRKRRRKLDDLPWSELSYNERQVLLESISVTVSDVLGPREQLELLRIIDPDVQTLPQDGQFTIEPDFLDNEKLEKIRKLIQSNIVSNQAASSDSSCTSSSKQRQTRGTSPKSSQKKKKSKERRNQLKALRQRQRREYKQNMKEKRSGLFQKEEVLALQSFTEEEEEIDILG